MSHPAPSNLFKSTRRYPAWLCTAVLVLATGGPALGKDPVQQEITRDFEKTVALSGNQGLSLDHRFGTRTHPRRFRPRGENLRENPRAGSQ